MALCTRALSLAGALVGTAIFSTPAIAAPVAAPAPAADLTSFGHSRPDPSDLRADWRCRGWGCRGWGGHRGWRRNRIDAGDVLIGAAIIGGALAIANSNNRRDRQRDVVIVERDPNLRDRSWDRRPDDRRGVVRGAGASGLDNAVNQCLDRIERDVRVDTVDNVERTGAGWRVSGLLFNGAPFQCRIGNGGQIDGIDFGDSIGSGFSAVRPGDAGERADGQWSNERYATARMAAGDPGLSGRAAPAQPGWTDPAPGERMPAYPGGPIPGEVIPETIDGDL